MIRVLLAEDQALVLGALSALLSLEDDLDVVGGAANGEAALELALTLCPDVLVTDIEMPRLSGLDLAARLRESLPATRVIIVTTFARSGYLRRALEVGARGYLLKDAPAAELADAIRRVQAGGRAIDPSLAESAWEAESPLTERERQVLTEAESGASTAAIAQTLKLSEGTVRNYLSEAMGKLGASGRVEAARGGQGEGVAVKIEDLKLLCRDLDAQRHFYSEVLGLPLLESLETQFAVQVGRTRLSFRHQPETAGVYHLAFNIPENQLAEAKRWISRRATLLDEDGNDEFTASGDWNAQMFYFRDPGGNILECIARHRLANASAQVFGPGSLLSISEIGYPVENVPQSVEYLRQQFGVNVFGTASDTFAPLGNDEGLLILVSIGRAWFPTGEAAAALPFELKIDGTIYDSSANS